jgi:hypothetical protein
MKHFYSLFLMLFMPFVCLNVNAQEKGPANSNYRALESGALGFDLGTNGPGIHIATSISPNVLINTGINFLYLNYDSKIGYHIPDAYLADKQYALQAQITDIDVRLLNFKWLLEYYPSTRGIFSLVGGVFFGKSSIKIGGMIDRITDLQDNKIVSVSEGTVAAYPRFDMIDGAITVQPGADGKCRGSIVFGNNFRPYAGVAIGRTIAVRSPLGFKLEAGLMYMGDFTFEGEHLTVHQDKLEQSEKKYLINSNVFDISNLMLVFNMSLSFRLF